MKKRFLCGFFTLLSVMVLIGCGSMSEDDVLSDLSKNLNSLESYKADVELTLQTGDEPHQYDVEAWHQRPDLYRISFTNRERDMTQIILKNEDGVFVLTPHLNKSFRFQSGWPDHQSQVYLYESLIQDVLDDSERTFDIEGNEYVFETEARYQNNSLDRQKIWFNEQLEPTKVQVMDADHHVLVEVAFSNIEMDPAFDENSFDMEENMQTSSASSSAMVDGEGEGEGNEEGNEEERSLGTFYPEYTAHAELIEEEEVTQDGESMVVLRYEGEDRSFSIVQQHPQSTMVTMPEGEPVDLGFAIGVQSERSLHWMYDGVRLILTGENMSKEDMVAIAQSIEGQTAK